MIENASPLVTVVIPTLNRTEYLKDAINSVINQSYQNLEIIVSDNGSKEDVSKILLPLLERDKRLIFRKNERTETISQHFNRCINIANGKYFMVLSDDDYISENFIELFVTGFEKNSKLSIGISSNTIIDELTGNIYKASDASWKVKNGLEFLNEWICNSIPAPVMTFISLFTRIDLIKAINGFPQFEIGAFGDNAVAVSLCFRGDILFESNAIFYYRVYPQSYGLSMSYKLLAIACKQYIDYIENLLSKLYLQNVFNKNKFINGIRYLTFETYFIRLTAIYKLKGLKKLKAFYEYGLTDFEIRYLIQIFAKRYKTNIKQKINVFYQKFSLFINKS